MTRTQYIAQLYLAGMSPDRIRESLTDRMEFAGADYDSIGFSYEPYKYSRDELRLRHEELFFANPVDMRTAAREPRIFVSEAETQAEGWYSPYTEVLALHIERWNHDPGTRPHIPHCGSCKAMIRLIPGKGWAHVAPIGRIRCKQAAPPL